MAGGKEHAFHQLLDAVRRVAQPCPTLCDPKDRILQAPLPMGFSKNAGVGCHFLLQGIFPTQGSNPCFLSLQHNRRIVYLLSHLGKMDQIIHIVFCDSVTAPALLTPTAGKEGSFIENMNSLLKITQ